MIKVSAIDDDLSVYRNKIVILFGAGKCGVECKNVFDALGISVAFFCDNDKSKWNTIACGIEVLSPEQLSGLCTENLIIQIASTASLDIEKQLESLKIECYISYWEFVVRIDGLRKYKTLVSPMDKDHYLQDTDIYNAVPTIDGRIKWNHAFDVKYFCQESYNILCLPPKTGDWTLNAAIENSGKHFVNFWHSYSRMTDELKEFLAGEKIKIITAVRDPVSQNLSIFFNMLECFWDIREYWENGGDTQMLFDSWIKHELKTDIKMHSKKCIKAFPFFEQFKQSENVEYVIQNWFQNKLENYIDIDLCQYPFDHRKGCMVISKDNYEIFVYQLEKLDVIRNDLARFLSLDSIVLVNENVGERKWYANAYKKAKQELVLTEEYIEYCYNSKYVKHFYCQEDIEQYKESWLTHIL